MGMGTISYIWYANTSTFSTQLERELTECLSRSVRLVLLNLTLSEIHEGEYKIGSGGWETHANMLIFDKQLMTLERYEPHGGVTPYKYRPRILDRELTEMTKILGFAYIAPLQYCGRQCGLQAKQEFEEHDFKLYNADRELFDFAAKTGYCVTWSFLWAVLRVNNPDIPLDKLVILAEREIKSKSTSLTRYIASFSHFLANMQKALKTNNEEYTSKPPRTSG